MVLAPKPFGVWQRHQKITSSHVEKIAKKALKTLTKSES